MPAVVDLEHDKAGLGVVVGLLTHQLIIDVGAKLSPGDPDGEIERRGIGGNADAFKSKNHGRDTTGRDNYRLSDRRR